MTRWNHIVITAICGATFVALVGLVAWNDAVTKRAIADKFSACLAAGGFPSEGWRYGTVSCDPSRTNR